MYKCSKCDLAVIVLPNLPIIKACDCNASVVMDLGNVTIEGKANVKQK